MHDTEMTKIHKVQILGGYNEVRWHPRYCGFCHTRFMSSRLCIAPLQCLFRVVVSIGVICRVHSRLATCSWFPSVSCCPSASRVSWYQTFPRLPSDTVYTHHSSSIAEAYFASVSPSNAPTFECSGWCVCH